ncbi:unnamed protein product, partial [Adineta ricciae]
HIPAIMAACQVIQKHGDADVALSKYRIIYGRKPECAQVWNNIGMCFFSKKKFVAAVSCLKRANYLAPFELYVLYNLALVHLYLQQNASAAIFLQSAIRINRKHAPSYALLGVALSKLNDSDNAERAYAYSLKLDSADPMTLLNYGIFQANTGVSPAKINSTMQQFHRCYAERAAAAANPRDIDASMLDVATKLGYPAPPPAPPSDLPTEKLSFPSGLPPPPAFPFSTNSNRPADDSASNVPPPPPPSASSTLSPSDSTKDDDPTKQSPPDEPEVKTKIYDANRHKLRRMKQEPT